MKISGQFTNPAQFLAKKGINGWGSFCSDRGRRLRRENASVQGVARQLGCTWRTLWRAVRPLLEAAADDEARFAGVIS